MLERAKLSEPDELSIADTDRANRAGGKTIDMQSSITPGSEQIKRNIRPVKKLDRTGLFKRDDFFLDDSVDFQGGSQNRSGFKLALWSWMSMFIDSLILISISCFSMILFSFLMKTPARDVLKFVSVEPNLTKMFMFSFLFSFWAYLVIMRVFMGASLGEWSCQLRLGQPIQRIKTSYYFRVIARTTLMLITGIVTIPILSIIFKRDLAGELTGIKIYSLV